MIPNDELEQAYRQGYEQGIQRSAERLEKARHLLIDALQFITITDNVEGLRDVNSWLEETNEFIIEGWGE